MVGFFEDDLTQLQRDRNKKDRDWIIRQMANDRRKEVNDAVEALWSQKGIEQRNGDRRNGETS